MRNPKMILFDYGQTLINEVKFDPVKGIQAVLDTATENPHSIRAESMMDLYYGLIKDINTPAIDSIAMQYIEVPDAFFQNYLYGYFGIKLTKSHEEVELIFETNAHTSIPSEGIGKLLNYLDKGGTRTGVISNTTMSMACLNGLLNSRIPENKFEFVITSSNYIFRKPHPRIFEYVLHTAGLDACDIWFCGDNPKVDIDGAAACGIFPVWYKGCYTITSDITPSCDCLELNDWSRLPGLISQAGGI